ncbi:MAG: hypothetical protein NTX17_00315 [Candidatus Eisenbacteria bacterium]|nr:hypothetical protein [Candidatus Eisenbacteria bacterium]
MTTEYKMTHRIPVIVVHSVILGVLLFTGSCLGSGMAISSSPNGSAVEFVGPIRISGVTAFELPMQLGGHFRVKIEKSGFETRVGWVDIGPQRPGVSPKVRAGANGAEVVTTLAGLAGPSKFVRGETQKGIILSITQGIAVLGAAREEWRAERYREKYQEFDSKYKSARNEEEAAVYHTKLSRNYEFAKNARFARNGYLMAAAVPAVYGFLENVLLDRGSGVVGAGANGLSFRLKPVSMSSSVLRGTLFPGMGHIYAGHKSAGTFWSASVVSAAGAALIAQQYYRDCQVRYSEALHKYETASTEEAVLMARQEVEDKFDTLDGASLAKRTLRGLTLGLWALSILDAARASTIAPEESGSVPGKSLSMDVSGTSGGVYVAVRVPIG